MENNKNWISADFVRICIMGFLASFGTSVSETLVTKYAQTLGALPGMIGMVSSVCSITALITLPLTAPLLDAVQKKKIYLIFTGFMAIAYAGFAFSRTVQALILFRLINGLGKGVNAAVAMAMASDVLPSSRRSSGIVWYSMISAVSVAFAPTAGLWLMNHTGFASAFLIGSALEITAMVLNLSLAFRFPASGKIRIRLDTLLARESVPAAFLMFLLSTAYSTVNSFLVVYATGMGISSIGWYFTVYSLMLLVSRPIIGRLSAKYSGTLLLLPGMLCFMTSMILTGISSNIAMFLLTAAVSSFGYGICQPLVQALAIQKAGEGRSGLGSSTCFIGTNLGYFAGPALGGMIAEAAGYRVMYLSMIVPLLFGMTLIAAMNRKGRENI